MDTPKTRQIGKILLEHGFITTQQLEHAIRTQQYIKHDRQFGHILVKLGYITEDELAVAIALQKGQAKTKVPNSK